MNSVKPPRFDTRRRRELRAELIDRARVWLPEWRRAEGGDFGAALIEIAARLSEQVTERLDRVPEKAFRGFLDWLGIRGRGARAARLPVVFTMTAGAEAVPAEPPVQFQALDVDPPVTFETERALTIVPARLASVVGVDTVNDAFYQPAARFSALEAPRAVPNSWRVRTDAPLDSVQIQLEPELGLEDLPTLIHVRSKRHYRVLALEAGIVTVDPPIGRMEARAGSAPPALPLSEGDEMKRLPSFAPFDDYERNRQQHELYIGSEALLNIKAPVRIGILGGGAGLAAGVDWEVWAKSTPQQPAKWLRMKQVPGDDLVLDKPAGQVEILEIEGKKSRWLRASTTPGKDQKRINLTQLKLTVDCDNTPRKCDATDPPSTVAIEAIANTTPVVFGVPFYPLGREPRLFDAFYLASPEAFSKKNAYVEICFQLADGTTDGYAAARMGLGDGDPILLFGVGKDGNLHRLQREDSATRPIRRLASVRPPFAENGTTDINAPSAALNPQQHSRISVLSRDIGGERDAVIAMTAGTDVWIWRQAAATTGSRWYRVGTFQQTTAAGGSSLSLPGVIAMHDGADALRLVAVAAGKLYTAPRVTLSDSGRPSVWTQVRLSHANSGSNDSWNLIAPIFSVRNEGGRHFDNRLTGASAKTGWLAVDDLGLAIFVIDDKAKEHFIRVDAIDKVSPTVPPLAIHIDGKVLVVVQQPRGGAPADTSDPELLQVVAWTIDVTKPDDLKVEKLAFDSDLAVDGSFDWHAGADGDVAVVFSGRNASDERILATWRPRSGRGRKPHDIPSSRSDTIDVLHGAPGILGDAIVASGSHAEIVVVGFHPERAHTIDVNRSELQDAWLIEGAAAPFRAGDVIAIGSGDTRQAGRPKIAPEASVGDYFFVHDFSNVKHDGHLEIFTPDTNVSNPFKGSLEQDDDVTTLTLDDEDDVAATDKLIAITHKKKTFQAQIKEVDAGVATLLKTIPVSGDVTYEYVLRQPTRKISDHPALKLKSLTAPQTAALVPDAGLRFDTAAPIQRISRLHPPNDKPDYAVLSAAWTTRPTQPQIKFIVDAVYEAPRILSEPRSVDPQLSWEYWDGTAWWTIQGLVDGTNDFLSSGKVSFCVPGSLQPTDVVGRTSHWIRARLVAGDYGRESVTIISAPIKDTDPPATKQTIDRSLDDIMAPLVVSADLYYSVCCPSLPDFVLTKDAGVVRDQSNANRTREASLELFVPLAETIADAGGGLPAADSSALNASAADTGLALYLGFDQEVTGSPISILFLVESRDHDEAFPLEVDVLRSHGFELVSLVDDGTRGLNETGVLSVTLSVTPQRSTLFGASLHWIRLRPNRRSSSVPWKPSIRAVYLNATWARASETQSNEVLGSSDGSPGQRVFLARPPILYNSLSLRVREPIGDDEFEQLRTEDQDAVTVKRNGEVEDRWVRWKEVVDPADYGPDERVYSLDDENGAITFGDGTHGKIPPPGLDAIVAERYKGGGGAKANGIGAWSQINLITPLQGVDGVAAPEGAAGGSDPQDPDTVLRFAPANLSVRERALTLRDLESLGLQFSPDIAQVRALARGPQTELVVVMRGGDPKPPRAVRREIVPYLLQLAPPDFGEKDAIVVREPRLIVLRISLRLAITAVERSGAVAREVTERVSDLLDPATGGADRTGWALGERLVETDIAAALDGVADLETILDIRIEQQRQGAITAIPAQLRPGDLMHLDPDSIEIAFDVAAEAMA